MESANVNGVELEYEVIGTGEPVLLISPVLADGFLPLLAEPALADRYQLDPVSQARLGRKHAHPAAGEHRGPRRRRREVSLTISVCNAPTRRSHSRSGAAVAAQLALDHPEYVHTLMLLELSLLSVPSGEAFFQQAGPRSRRTQAATTPARWRCS